MDALLAALYTKFAASTLYQNVYGRLFLDEYQGDLPIQYPYAIYTIVSAVPDRTFTEYYIDVSMQVSLYSMRTAGAIEMSTMYSNLNSLLDDGTLSITGYKLVWMREVSLVSMPETVEALPDGSNKVNRWDVDYDIRISKN